jgi:hypothetical protein
MIDRDHSTSASNLAAIDIAKDWNAALVQEASGRRHSFKFANRRADHDDFVAFLHSLSGPVRVGLESTGDYHRSIAYVFLPKGSQWFPSRHSRWHASPIEDLDSTPPDPPAAVDKPNLPRRAKPLPLMASEASDW